MLFQFSRQSTAHLIEEFLKAILLPLALWTLWCKFHPACKRFSVFLRKLFYSLHRYHVSVLFGVSINSSYTPFKPQAESIYIRDCITTFENLLNLSSKSIGSASEDPLVTSNISPSTFFRRFYPC